MRRTATSYCSCNKPAIGSPSDRYTAERGKELHIFAKGAAALESQGSSRHTPSTFAIHSQSAGDAWLLSGLGTVLHLKAEMEHEQKILVVHFSLPPSPMLILHVGSRLGRLDNESRG